MNWGTKLVLGLSGFMLFIISMVVYMFMVHGNDALVDEDYYEKGINYNQEYNAKRNVLLDNAQPVIKVTKSQIVIQFKEASSYKLKLMRPSTNNDDLHFEGLTNGTSNEVHVETSKMHSGLWYLEIKWTNNGKEYLVKNNITI